MAALLKSHNIEFAVALYPDEFQVNPTLRQQLIASFGLRLAEYDLELPQRLARTHLEALQVPVIDLLKPFQERGKEEALYLLRNTHWNGAGRQLAGELLFANLSPWLDELLKKSP